MLESHYKKDPIYLYFEELRDESLLEKDKYFFYIVCLFDVLLKDGVELDLLLIQFKDWKNNDKRNKVVYGIVVKNNLLNILERITLSIYDDDFYTGIASVYGNLECLKYLH